MLILQMKKPRGIGPVQRHMVSKCQSKNLNPTPVALGSLRPAPALESLQPLPHHVALLPLTALEFMKQRDQTEATDIWHVFSAGAHPLSSTQD